MISPDALNLLALNIHGMKSAWLLEQVRVLSDAREYDALDIVRAEMKRRIDNNPTRCWEHMDDAGRGTCPCYMAAFTEDAAASVRWGR